MLDLLNNIRCFNQLIFLPSSITAAQTRSNDGARDDISVNHPLFTSVNHPLITEVIAKSLVAPIAVELGRACTGSEIAEH
jgi:hypothetical protein